MDADQERDEQHHREAESAMDILTSAAKALDRSAAALRADGAAEHLAEAIEAAAESVRADHKQLIKAVYWVAPTAHQTELI